MTQRGVLCGFDLEPEGFCQGRAIGIITKNDKLLATKTDHPITQGFLQGLRGSPVN